MCAILDASIASEVFGHNRPEAGVKFFNWINTGRGRLLAGGKLLEELNKTQFREWARQALNSGIVTTVDEPLVNKKIDELVAERSCRSNDPHVIALAIVGGGRLLYSNDKGTAPGLHEQSSDQQSTWKSLLHKQTPELPEYSQTATREDGSLRLGHALGAVADLRAEPVRRRRMLMPVAPQPAAPSTRR